MKIPRVPKPPTIQHPSSSLSRPEGEPDDRIMGLFSLEGASDAMRLNDFDQEELFTNLISKTRSHDPETSMQAIGLLWKISKDIAAANGKFTKQQASHQGTAPNGKAVILTTSRTILSSSPSFGSGSFTAPGALPPIQPPLTLSSPSGGAGDEVGGEAVLSETGPDEQVPEPDLRED